MHNIYYKINCPSLGDTLCATPSLRKIYKAYNKKINIVTHVKELFLNNPFVENIYSFDEFSRIQLNPSDEVFTSFWDVGSRNDRGVEKKHATMDIRQLHAYDLGFSLTAEEMECDYIPEEYSAIPNVPEKYVVFHVGSSWPSRTYDVKKWQKLLSDLNSVNIPVILVGKNSFETGFYNIDKKTIDLNVNLGVDLTNQLSLSQCWHIISRAEFFITMDSGLLHLAGTTDVNIIQLGSSINNKFRAPYRKGSQDYKYKYILGSCDAFCASDLKHSVKEWKSIQSVPPLINCLENKSSFECHPDPNLVFDYVKENIELISIKKKILFFVPHLSTGGSPAYAEWLIKKRMSEGCDVYVVEYCYYGSYEIHRKKIIKLVGDEKFFSFGGINDSDEEYHNKSEFLINFINELAPDEIFLNEVAEIFSLKVLTDKISGFLFSKDRKFKLIETCHTSDFDFSTKYLIPDEFHFCSKYHLKLTDHIDIPKQIVDMEINKKTRPDRFHALSKLNLDPDKFHVVNVALFHRNKNQKFLYDLAEKFQEDVVFHFIGNTCFFHDCDLTERQKKFSNCIVHDELDNVDDYLAACDLFVLPSFRELNPIALKEALSWNMNCFVSDIETLRMQFSDNKLVNFIKDDNLYEFIMKRKNKYKNSFRENSFTISYKQNSVKLEIVGNLVCSYNVEFLDEDDNVIFNSTINNNMWCACNIQDHQKIFIRVNNIDFNKCYVLDAVTRDIVNESGSLGDFLAWVPVVNEYAVRNSTKINFYTPFIDLLELEAYPLINFIPYSDKGQKLKSHYIKLFYDINGSQKYSLQNVGRKALGLDMSDEEVKPILKKSFKKGRNFAKKYVCIATQSTSQAKYWNNKDGWVKTVDYLKFLGYEVICIDKHSVFGIEGSYNTIPYNCTDKTGDINLSDRINDLLHCDFFIGLGSGLSWLAWACNRPVIMISGFSKPYAEFKTPYRVINESVCNGCWSNANHLFDSSNWSWCPENKNFECTKEITFEMVKVNIDNLIKDNSL